MVLPIIGPIISAIATKALPAIANATGPIINGLGGAMGMGGSISPMTLASATGNTLGGTLGSISPMGQIMAGLGGLNTGGMLAGGLLGSQMAGGAGGLLGALTGSQLPRGQQSNPMASILGGLGGFGLTGSPLGALAGMGLGPMSGIGLLQQLLSGQQQQGIVADQRQKSDTSMPDYSMHASTQVPQQYQRFIRSGPPSVAFPQ